MKMLHLEDDGHDAELVHTLLREEWPDCAITVVSERASFLTTLRRFTGFNASGIIALIRISFCFIAAQNFALVVRTA